jgi:RHH-type proline utilization regulon transcriptional repressor/proline dehydrogenase/delta 1-pyrroline-5-carboxylate dehydrogenase
MSNTALWQALSASALTDEHALLEEFRHELDHSSATQQAITNQAALWIQRIRTGNHPNGVEALLLEYPLSQPEGVALMCLAEALLRIPNPATADALIRDLLDPIAWQTHIGHSDSLLVNAASWGLALTGRWLATTEQPEGDASGWLQRLAGKLGGPVLRQALRQTMRHMAEQFVLGEDLPSALERARVDWAHGVTHSFDMLGEAALTVNDSERYWQAYRSAIDLVGSAGIESIDAHPSISIKLSALHPRYCAQQMPRLQKELLPALCELAEAAAAVNVHLTIDAEEADRLELSLQLFEQLLHRVSPRACAHLGVVVQAYGKRSRAILRWLQVLAHQHAVRLNIRLVKGAYWDTEIKRAQQRGLSSYPVFTSKAATDVSYLACARALLQQPDAFFPQFATHNAVTVAAILQMQPDTTRYEFQRLHGMGEALYQIVREDHPTLRTRVYAPVGEHRDLLPYLVRRLLENGANSSFIHQLHDSSIAIEQLATHPMQHAPTSTRLPSPRDIWPEQRRNSPGIDWYSEYERETFLLALEHARKTHYEVSKHSDHDTVIVRNPTNGKRIGSWQPTLPAELDAAVLTATRYQPKWHQTPIETRAEILEYYAELLIDNRAEMIALMARETGKTIENGMEEIRETIDFSRYYAQHARSLLQPQARPAVTGESNTLLWEPRGVFACISPWNFPLSIFSGQIIAALAMGNTVLAKPAEQATLTAQFATQLLHQSGVPRDALQLVCGDGGSVGSALCAQTSLGGIVFTGGGDTARSIQRQLAQRDGAMIPFIAETAGINALIADSSAQPQQLVSDVIRSAFDSAGQRCSALRVLFLPESCADAIETLIFGAMQELKIGDPLDWNTDVGPIIDTEAKNNLQKYLAENSANIEFQTSAPATSETQGNFMPLTVLRIQQLSQLQREAFGPILHIIRYRDTETDAVIDEINSLGFGLTCGIHSRNPRKAQALAAKLRIGNIYINRDIIGAVVGAQPFGGRGKSGTGPKAGGPNYLQRFSSEKIITINTAALGGDHILMTK